MPLFDLLALQYNATSLMLETHTVMTLRILGMTGALPSRRDENLVMFAEKGPAMARSITAGNTAMMQGRRPDEIMSAALVPLAHKVRANRKRLMK